MQNVVRIVHDVERDQLHLLGTTRDNRTLPPLKDSVSFLEEVIAAVDSASGSDVVLAFAFSNILVNHLYAGAGRASCRTRLVYPLHDDPISYHLNQGRFFASQHGDPIVVYPGAGSHLNQWRAVVLCERNPFLHEDYRPEPLGTLLRDCMPRRPKSWRPPQYVE